MADAAVAAYTARYPAAAEAEARWGPDRGAHLRIATHLVDELPPLEFVTSVRCLLFRGDELMVLKRVAGYAAYNIKPPEPERAALDRSYRERRQGDGRVAPSSGSSGPEE